MTVRSPVPAAEISAGDTREQERVDAANNEILRWRATTFIECDLIWSRVGAVTLEGGRLLECHVVEPDVEELAASDTTWRQTRISEGRIGSLVLARSHLDSVTLSGTRIGYLDLRSAAVGDLTLTDCRIGTLDLTGGRVERARLRGCRIDELLLSHAEPADVDLRGAQIGRIEGATGLRGATVDSGQLMDLAPLLADALGIVVSDG